MRKYFFIVFFFFCTWANAQDKSVDFKLLLGEEVSSDTDRGVVAFKGLLKLYHNYFSEQIINDCIYEYSCSTFSQGSISEFGLIKGGVMSIDRLMRCNRASGLDFVPSYFNEKGEIKDHWSAYHKH